MTKKTIIGAAVMALPALALTAGSANAERTPADAGIATTPGAVLNEIAVHFGGGSQHDYEGSVVELTTDVPGGVSLDNYRLQTCSATGSLTTVLDEFDFQSTDLIPEDGFFLIGDQTYAAQPGLGFEEIPDIVVSSLNLEQDAGGLRLTDTNASLSDAVKWASPADPVCDSFPDAGVSPDDDNSLQRNTTPPPTWCALPPTPGATNGSC